MIAQPDEERATTIPGDTGADWGKWSWEFDLDAAANAGVWPDDNNANTPGNAATYTLSAADLRGANMLRVDTRTNDGAATNAGWKMDHDAAAIPPPS